MPFYASLKRSDIDQKTRTRIAEGLLRLRKLMTDSGVPKRTIDGDVLIASWNIREFDNEKYGWRTIDAFYYIAEIISHFDLVAIQEVNANLAALDKVQSILGGWWKYIVTDVSARAGGGNDERMAFMYDSRKVTFGGLAGEIVLPPSKVDTTVLQFARTPFVCGFRAGWAKIDLCTVHIYYGDSKPLDERRLEEIQKLAKLMAARAKKRDMQPARPQGKTTAIRNPDGDNIILLGDFNIFDPGDETLKAITKAGFVVPDALADRKGSNIAQNKFYDQIAIWRDRHRIDPTERAGVINYYEAVFREEDADDFKSLIGKAKSGKPYSFKEWRTYQMSDHLVLWAAFKVDYAEEYLQDLRDMGEDEDQ